MNFNSIDLAILLPAFAAGLLVTLTLVPLGMQVLARGIVFIDLAVAQIAGLGVILADAFGWEPLGAAVQVAALSAAVAGALFLTWTERRWPEVQEAIIGVVFQKLISRRPSASSITCTGRLQDTTSNPAGKRAACLAVLSSRVNVIVSP